MKKQWQYIFTKLDKMNTVTNKNNVNFYLLYNTYFYVNIQWNLETVFLNR